MDEVIVSIICNTYNHENYIRKCLEGFIMQKTEFRFEVLIHDDASTDKTQIIIKEYEEKYPHLIKPIYQTENQYSKGVNITKAFQIPRAKGNYFAFCEGDDFWIDPLKLQKQVDVLETHQEIDMCAHAAYVFQGNKHINNLCPSITTRVLTVADVIYGGGGYLATASLLYRKSLYEMKYKFREILYLDYSLQILGALRGGIFFIEDYMSVYNFCTPNSWTLRNSNSNKQLEINKKIESMLTILNRETEYKYSEVIEKRIMLNEYEYSKTYGPYKDLKKGQFKKIYKKESIKEKLKINLKIMFPFLVTVKSHLRRIRNAGNK